MRQGRGIPLTMFWTGKILLPKADESFQYKTKTKAEGLKQTKQIMRASGPPAHAIPKQNLYSILEGVDHFYRMGAGCRKRKLMHRKIPNKL